MNRDEATGTNTGRWASRRAIVDGQLYPPHGELQGIQIHHLRCESLMGNYVEVAHTKGKKVTVKDSLGVERDSIINDRRSSSTSDLSTRSSPTTT